MADSEPMDADEARAVSRAAEAMLPRERPILFSGPMVRAILEGRKTQTRRIVKHEITSNGIVYSKDLGDIVCHDDYLPPSEMIMRVNKRSGGYHVARCEGWESECPYGAPGDRLWVKETWRVAGESNNYPTDRKNLWVEYRAGAVAGCGQQRSVFSIKDDDDLARRAWGNTKSHQWRPSIFMSRWASRITLEVTGVRVERLQDISQDDAVAEGIDKYTMSAAEKAPGGDIPRRAFAKLWESINGLGSWHANPWVWCISFKRVQP